jgi:hypothetical protein
MSDSALLAHLRRQLRFIKNSCDSYDAGFDDEAVRIATQLRVLFHDTPKSTSLLTLLGAPDTLLLSTSPIITADFIMFLGGLSNMVATLEFATGKLSTGKYEPTLKSPPDSRYIHWKEWWNQDIYLIDSGRISRSQIVCSAANKDGGAHVDQKLTKQYAELKRGIFTIGNEKEPTETHISVPDSQYSDLRQMGYEILNSPELLALAGS